MHRIAFALGLAAVAALCLAAAQASAQPPGHAKRSQATTKKADEDLRERALDGVLDRRGAEPTSNAQWLPDARRGQARAAERRPAHAGPKHTRENEAGLLDRLLGADERSRRALSKRERKEKLGKLRKQKRRKGKASGDLVGVLVEKAGTAERKAKN